MTTAAVGIWGYLGRDGADRRLLAAQMEHGSTSVREGNTGVESLLYSKSKREARLNIYGYDSNPEGENYRRQFSIGRTQS
jgi:hypothetical protein